MNALRTTILVWVLGGLALATGLTIAWRTWQGLPEQAQRMHRKLNDLNELRMISETAGRDREVRMLFDPLAGQPASDLGAILGRTLPGRAPVDVRETREPAVDGWAALRREFSLPEAPLAEVAAFMRAAEAERPPWRVIKCAIRSSAQARGNGQATVQFETLVKQE